MKLEFHGLSKQFDQGRMILQPMDFCDEIHTLAIICLLYTSDAADEL